MDNTKYQIKHETANSDLGDVSGNSFAHYMIYAKEVAFICSFLTWTNIIDNATIFASFDYYYEIAEAFIRTYPLSTKWGIENDGADYEETLESFANDYVTKHGIRI